MWRDWSIFISNYPTSMSPLGGKSNLARYWFVTETATGWQSQTLTMTFYCSKCPTSKIREKFGQASVYCSDMQNCRWEQKQIFQGSYLSKVWLKWKWYEKCVFVLQLNNGMTGVGVSHRAFLLLPHTQLRAQIFKSLFYVQVLCILCVHSFGCTKKPLKP